MKTIRICNLFSAALLVGATAILGVSTTFAQSSPYTYSGGVVLGHSIIEPAIEDMTGKPVFILETQKSPFPVVSNPRAAAPIYAVMYPPASTVSPLDCLPTNCDHDQVAEMAHLDSENDYGQLDSGTCGKFTPNGATECSAVKGLDILLGLASTGGDFNVPWNVNYVFFTDKAFQQPPPGQQRIIDQRITSLGQLWALHQNGYVYILDTPVTFDCAPVSESTYDRGTPEVINFTY